MSCADAFMHDAQARLAPRSQTREFARHNTDHLSHERNNLSGRLLMADFDDGQESNPMLEKAKLVTARKKL